MKEKQHKYKRFYNVFSLKEKTFSHFNSEIYKRNLYDERFITRWKEIVGEKYAKKLYPVKIVINGIDEQGIQTKILYCSTCDIAFLSVFQFFKKDILSKLNMYFGTEKSSFVELKLLID